MAEAGGGNEDGRDPVIEQFVELRKYIEHSHDGLSKRLDGVETRLGSVESRLGGVESRLGGVEAGQKLLERRVDSGFDRLGRKIDALGTRRAPARRRKP